MAKVSVQEVEEVFMVPTSRMTEYVVLTLSEDEVRFLWEVTEVVGGCPRDSARKYSDSIRRVLRGLPCISSKYTTRDFFRHDGSIHFTTEPGK